jgi:hypothetical protein
MLQETMAAAANRLSNVLSDSWGLFKKPILGTRSNTTDPHQPIQSARRPFLQNQLALALAGNEGQTDQGVGQPRGSAQTNTDATKKFVSGVENVFASLSAQMQGFGLAGVLNDYALSRHT